MHHGLTLPVGANVGIHGGWLGLVLHRYPSDMAQNFWTAIFAWTVCMLLTVGVSLVTRPRPDGELRGLVYALTERPDDTRQPWIRRPATLALVILAMLVALNVIFF